MSSDRIDGWKAIGAYFNRDRTTVMRWARTRSLPVRRLPGGKISTVFALRQDLDRWASSQSSLDDEPPADTQDTGAALSKRVRLFWAAGAAVLTAVIVAAALLWPRDSGAPTVQTLPSDPALSQLYLQARGDWAQRRPETLARAIVGFETLTRAEPDYAPGWAGLAEAYILAREFGTMTDDSAFPKAKAAAETALRHDPDLASAHRALGFVHYWWDNASREAGVDFRRALALAPRDAQTHFWYGNILADNGQHVAAMRELDTARLIEPGSVAIQVDHAWAQWGAGNEAEARQAFDDLARSHPEFAVIFDCLSEINLSDGDYVGYIQNLGTYARLRKDDALLKHVEALRTALKTGTEAVQDALMRRALAEIASGEQKTHIRPVFLASLAQNRKQTLAFLEQAEIRQEVWGNAATTTQIRKVWLDDAEIAERVRRRRAELVE
ncbi:tetratricopeptide repeat protein [Asticcacaulis endophyticus]|uniref:tetratricopeptide repeat protein n=1 Tax=Asticcacaulis endophyticus TaxID=1395890 RepID=UPI001672461E|nr:tetratricopeptide repeat protein [Asticcacaulis endophyticus]